MEAFFTSKVYLVTGAGSGIGLAITSLLLEYGAHVYAIDLSETQSPALAGLPQDRLTYLQGDVKDRLRSNEIVTLIVQQRNQLDGLVNCAAVCLEEGELPGDELYDPTFDVNVRGSWNYASEALTHMKIQGRGSVVNIGSLASLAAEARLPIYAATKHALAGFTKTWARDFAKYGVRVNMVAPGPTDTLMVRRTIKKVMGPIYGLDKTEDELLEHVKVHIPLGRLGEPGEIADAVAFFLSNFSSFVTGQVLVVGGGM